MILLPACDIVDFNTRPAGINHRSYFFCASLMGLSKERWGGNSLATPHLQEQCHNVSPVTHLYHMRLKGDLFPLFAIRSIHYSQPGF